MSSAVLTFPPAGTARLVVDTDVASYVFKWHPKFAPRYVEIIRGSELVLSFMTKARWTPTGAHNNLGALLVKKGAVDRAIRRYRRGIEARPDFAEAHFNLGATLADQGRSAAARQHFHSAVKSRPNY